MEEIMPKSRIFVLSVLTLILMCAASFGMDDARLMRSPDINGDRIVFVYGGDLWSVNTKGGTAVRLTSFAGSETQPRFSPDGKWIAFSGEYDGNRDVFIIPSTGGEPKRLTWHPDADAVAGWTPDSKKVVFFSSRGSYSRFPQIFTTSIDGSFPEMLPFPMGTYTAFSPDGKHIAYTPLVNAFNTWRRYRGGLTNFIWIYNKSDNSVKKVPHPNCSDTFPVWIGDEIYFLSDRDRVMNLYSYNMKKDELKQLTKFEGADIKTYGADKNNIVFERDGYLNLMDIKSGKIDKLTVNIPNEGIVLRPHFTKAGRLINNFNISPSGQRAVFETRGEIVSVPAKKGDIRNLTNTTAVVERTPAWSPDGKSIAYFGEVDGEYALQIVDQMGTEKPKIVKLDSKTYYFDLIWSPDSKMLAFTDIASNLYYINVSIGKQTLVDTDPEFLNRPAANWSPDSKWLVYAKNGSNRIGSIYLYSLDAGKSYKVTDEMSNAFGPVFDRSGKYIYFGASTDSALDLSLLDMTSWPYQPTAGLYLMILSKDEANPFKPESDDEKATDDKDKKDAKEEKDKKDGKDKKEEKKTKIDLDGIGNRIVAINVPERQYFNINAGEEGKLFYMEFNRIGNNSDLHVYNIKDRKDEVVLSGINTFTLSADGKKILYQKNNFVWTIGNAGSKPNPETDNVLRTEAIETYSDPLVEYRQMLFECWRIYREYFYDPGMHGHDWNAIWKQYETYLPYMTHRSDLNYVIGMMIGEMAIGHAYVGGGEYPEIENVAGGLLGADYEIVDGLYRIKKIYRGENWNPNLRSPLTEPGVNVNEGDYILEVNGKPVKAADSIYSFFQKTAGKQVTIKINSKPELTGAKVVTVIPIPNETSLRNKEWIEGNRKKVEELSGGKAGYVYLPNTSVEGYNYFNRYYFSHLDKEAMVIDERFNGGGFAADYIIDMLSRQQLCWWQGRYGREASTPQAQVYGPKVMLINEFAGSGGDAMPYYFRLRGLGKLIGKRTWGGLVGISGYPPLMDGGYVTAPSFGIVGLDGTFVVENHGVDPDIEVEITPADFIAGRDPQLEAGVKTVMEELKKNPPLKYKHEDFPRGR
jgi:tricorn protease